MTNDIENDETTRTIQIPVTTFREMTIALPFYGKEDKGHMKYFHKLTAKRLYSVAFYSHDSPALYSRRADTCMDAEDKNVASWDVSTPEEFYQAFDQYKEYIENI